MSRLVSRVHVPDENGLWHGFGPEDEVPEWAARQMGAHCFEDGDHPYAAAAESPDDGSSDDGDGSEDAPPPKGGPGSGVDAWRAYAAKKGVKVEDDANRDDVIAALQSAGHPVD
jgi:hypothetical protein